MPVFPSIEPTARSLRPLSDHRLVGSPLRSPAGPTAARRGVIRRTRPLLGGVAVLAVAGALSAGMPTAGHAAAFAPSPALQTGTPANSPAAPFASLLRPVAYTVPAAPAAAEPRAATVHVPSVSAHPNAPKGAAVVTHHDTVLVKAMSSDLRRLRDCESGGNYREATGNGYYGAYQFDLSTWHSLGLAGYPNYASAQLQDTAVVRLEARKGWGPGPVCGRYL